MKEIAMWLKEIAIQLQIMNRKSIEPEIYQVYGMLSEKSAEERMKYTDHPTEKGGANDA